MKMNFVIDDQLSPAALEASKWISAFNDRELSAMPSQEALCEEFWKMVASPALRTEFLQQLLGALAYCRMGKMKESEVSNLALAVSQVMAATAVAAEIQHRNKPKKK